MFPSPTEFGDRSLAELRRRLIELRKNLFHREARILTRGGNHVLAFVAIHKARRIQQTIFIRIALRKKTRPQRWAMHRRGLTRDSDTHISTSLSRLPDWS